MYGLINKSIEELIVEKFGEVKWSQILEESQIDPDSFITNEYYDDAITLSLIDASCKLLNLSSEKLLFTFGEHWILKTGMEKYKPILQANGTTLQEFLINLPSFHSRVMLIYPEITPPDFFIEQKSNTEFIIHYHSQRTGLTEFMRGLLHGIGQLFDININAELLQEKGEKHDHDIFLLKW
jgi:hypothetical protein